MKGYIIMVHWFVWMWMLDTDKKFGKKTWTVSWGTKNVVHQTNNENNIDWKEVKRRSNGNGRIQKILTQNHQEKTTTVFGYIKRHDWLEKQILSGKIYGTKSRGIKRTKYTDSLNYFVMIQKSANKELMSRNDDRGHWKAMIADVCNRPGTCRMSVLPVCYRE